MVLLVTQLRSIGRGIFHHNEQGVEELTYGAKPDDASRATTLSPSSISSAESNILDDDDDEVKSLLGSEKNLLNVQQEIQGVRDIMAALSDAEKKEVPDKCMFIRHLRAEKVRAERVM